MTLNFNNIDMSTRPQLILRNLDCKAFGSIGSAFNIQANLKFNEVSDITFDVPASDNGESTPFYNEIKSMNIVDLKGLGQFILKSAKVTSDGIREVKQCTCYSLEYEMSYKQFFATKGTYNFWNPVAPSGTVLGMILEVLPYWSIGTVDPKLIGKYRTFEASNVDVLGFLKNSAQQTYSCIITFDTYNRKINAVDISSIVPTTPVYLSLYNLIKEIEVTEETENIFTCIEAFGADDVTIRSVNPLGTNKIYNLDYYMVETNFSLDIINKWNNWKALFEAKQIPYYNLKIQESSQTSRLLTEKSALTDMKSELKKLESLQSVSIQYLGEHPNDPTEQTKLDKINADIRNQKTTIRNQESYLITIQSELDSIKIELTAINNSLAFTSTFTQAEILSMSKYVKEGSIQESSFVVSKVQNYNNSDISSKHINENFSITNSNITNIPNDKSKEIYSIVGGSLTCPCGDSTTVANIVRGSMERKQDGSFVFSCYLNSGYINTVYFQSGNISSTGTCGAITHNDENMSFTASSTTVYFTRNATEYEARSVQFDLYDYAKQSLNGMAVPTYTFSVQPANFLALEDFSTFKDNFELGKRVYIEMGDKKVLKPVAIAVSINFEDYTNFSIEFSNSYKSNDPSFSLVDLLGQSISMGKTVDSSKYTYSSWVDSGASTDVKSFIESALDLTKNEIISSSDQAVTIDQNGMRYRKWNAGHTDYEPEQMWAINNSIAMTDDNWATAKMAIGKFTDKNLGSSWGIVAPNIRGTILAGTNLVIESEKKDGGKSVFKVDASGAQLYNSVFDLYDGANTQITLNPKSGIAIGSYPLYTEDHTINEANAKFWLDANGNIHMKGDVTANNFYFNDGGNIKTLLSESQKKIPSTHLDLGNIKLNGDTGDITMTGSIDLGGDISFANASSITWNSNTSPVKYQFSVDGTTNWHTTMTAEDKYKKDSLDGGKTWGNPYQFTGSGGGDLPSYIHSTYIDQTEIRSPTISGGLINGGEFRAIGDSTSGNSEVGIYATPNDKYGYIRYDNNGTGVDAVERMFIATTNEKAMKIQSSGNMSIDAGEDKDKKIFIGSTVVFGKQPEGFGSSFELQALNMYNNGFSAQYSDDLISFNYTKDGLGRITKLITEDNVEIPITWNAGGM